MFTSIPCSILRVAAAVFALIQQMLCAAGSAHAFAQPDSVSSQVREQAVQVVARIRRADYEGDRAALQTLVNGLSPVGGQPAFSSRVHYWRGFALWRRALNGFNQSADSADLQADLERAVEEFGRASALDRTLADASIGMVSCLQNLAYVLRADAGKVDGLVKRFVPLMKDLSTTAAENPRFLWVQGASLWYPLPGLSEAEIAERRGRALHAYQRGLSIVRATAPGADPLEPSWGEAELLMNLAWSHLNAAAPDLALAETHARQALALAPDWQYVRDILLPQIRQTRAQRRLDVFHGRWTVGGRIHAEAHGAAAGETAGVAVFRPTARDNWLLSEVTLASAPPYGVTLLIAPTPDAAYVAVAVNNLVPAPLQYVGRWIDERTLEFESSATGPARRQRVRYTVVSGTQVELAITESRDEGRTYHPHSSLTLTREPGP
jgi:hypothetical protein